jgi:hypothetical protein
MSFDELASKLTEFDAMMRDLRTMVNHNPEFFDRPVASNTFVNALIHMDDFSSAEEL